MSERREYVRRTDDKESARHQAREVILEFFETLGMEAETPEGRAAIRRDFQWVRAARKGSEEIGVWTRRAIITSGLGAAISAFILGVKVGIKTIVNSKIGGG